MIRFLPVHRETIVLPFTSREVSETLWKATKPLKNEHFYPYEADNDFFFNGHVKENTFRVSLMIRRPENFLPVISGRIEKTSVGSIIFVKYKMFFVSTAFLTFWSVITVLMACFFGYIGRYWYMGIAIVLAFSNYAVAVVNFKLQVKRSSRVLHSIFNKIDKYI